MFCNSVVTFRVTSAPVTLSAPTVIPVTATELSLRQTGARGQHRETDQEHDGQCGVDVVVCHEYSPDPFYFCVLMGCYFISPSAGMPDGNGP